MRLYLITNHFHDNKGKTVNKSDLIDAIAAGADISKASAGRALDSALGGPTCPTSYGPR